MIYITNEQSSPFTIESNDHCYLDIESTGLSKNLDTIVCIGLAYFNGNTLTHSHWIIENIEEEAVLISTFLQEVTQFKKVYTYGGKHFEWPFILEKAQSYVLDTSLLTTLHLVDLKSSRMPRASFESLIGFKRLGDTSGRELAKLCKLFLVAPLPNYQTLICKHNAEELSSILAVYYFYKFLGHLTPSMLDTYCFEKDRLVFTLSPPTCYPYSFDFEQNGCKVTYDHHTHKLLLSLNCVWLKLKTYLPYRDYYLVEGALMHKSLARLLPTSMRKKVSKSECYLEKEDFYLPLDLACETLKWQDDTKQIYTPYNIETLSTQIQEILKIILKKITQKQ